MNHIYTAKTQLRDALIAGGLDVQEYVPERLVPPVAMISAGNTYLELSNFKDDYALGLEVRLVAATATNLEAEKALDQLIQDFVLALPTYATLSSIGQPYMLSANTAEYLTASATITLHISLED